MIKKGEIMKILITGGSGVLRINLTRHLLAKGIKGISILDIANFDYLEKNEVNFIKGNIRDKNIVSRVMKGVDAVVHAAVALPLYKKQEIYSTDVDGHAESP